MNTWINTPFSPVNLGNFGSNTVPFNTFPGYTQSPFGQFGQVGSGFNGFSGFGNGYNPVAGPFPGLTNNTLGYGSGFGSGFGTGFGTGFGNSFGGPTGNFGLPFNGLQNFNGLTGVPFNGLPFSGLPVNGVPGFGGDLNTNLPFGGRFGQFNNTLGFNPFVSNFNGIPATGFNTLGQSFAQQFGQSYNPFTSAPLNSGLTSPFAGYPIVNIPLPLNIAQAFIQNGSLPGVHAGIQNGLPFNGQNGIHTTVQNGSDINSGTVNVPFAITPFGLINTQTNGVSSAVTGNCCQAA